MTGANVPSPDSGQAKLHFCPNCGEALPSRASRYCGNCGTQLDLYTTPDTVLDCESAVEDSRVDEKNAANLGPMALQYGPIWRPLSIVLVVSGACCPIFQFADITYWMLLVAVVDYFLMVHCERVVGRSGPGCEWLMEQASADSCLAWFFVFLVIGSGTIIGIACRFLFVVFAFYRYLNSFGMKPDWVPGQGLVLLYLGLLAVVFLIGMTTWVSITFYWLLIGLVFITRGVWAYLESTPPKE